MTELALSEFYAPWQPNTQGWEFSQVKNHFDVILGKMLQNTPNSHEDVEVPYIKAQHVQWDKVIIDELPTMWASPWEVEFLKIEQGDLLVCEGGEAGRAGIVKDIPPKGTIIQNAVHLVRPKKGGDIKFLRYLLQHAASHGWLDVICNRATIAHFTVEKFNQLWAWFPPLAKQRAIADYLDRETTRLDSLIARKLHLLDLLVEKRNAVITHAVTRGLSSRVSVRESGIDWLGNIPTHWKVDIIKRHFDIELGKMLDSNKQQNEQGELRPYLRAANIFWEGTWLDDVNEMIFTSGQLERYRLQKGDLLVTEGGVTVGRSAIWQGEIENCYYQNSLNRARPKGTVPTKFLYYWLYFLKLNGYIDIVAEKSTFGHLTKEKLQVIPMTVLPKDEATKIVETLDSELQKISKIESKIKEVIDLLHERRTSLIAAAVSGQIRVV